MKFGTCFGRHSHGPLVGGYSLSRLLLTGVLMLGFTVSLRSIVVADSMIQCTPSGFTVGIPPFHMTRGALSEHVSVPLRLDVVQDALAEVFAKSGLFSNVAVLREVPRPDSMDLTLLVSISQVREVEGSGGSDFELSLSVLLIENIEGHAIFQQEYFRRIRGRFASTVPKGIGPSVDVERAFSTIATEIVRDLNTTLNGTSDFEISELKKSRTMSHSFLAEMRVLPTIVADSRGGQSSYSRYVNENLRERIQRKNCFRLNELPKIAAQCLEDSLRSSSDQSYGNLSQCLVDLTWHGFLLVSWISPLSDSLRIRSVLLAVPEMEVAYDKSLTTTTGWRLGNALEQHAAGIAQAAHGRPH